MAKLKDKATIDGHIDFINLMFSDQYGRCHTLKFEAEHFIEKVERGDANFVYEQNPFAKYIGGKKIAGIELGEELVLKPDLGTLRLAPWLKNEAFILTNLNSLDGK